MVVLNKTYRKTLTPDRSAKDSGHRFYSPDGVSRWLSRDPIGENGGINVYGFVGNRPSCVIDFLGLRIWYLIERTYLAELANRNYAGFRQSRQIGMQTRDIRERLGQWNRLTAATSQPEFSMNYHEFRTLDELGAYAEQGEAGDHFIIHAHGDGTGMLIGRSVELDEDGRHPWRVEERHRWTDRDMISALRRFRGNCITLTFYVCRVSQAQARRLGWHTGARAVFYAPGRDELPWGEFGLVGVPEGQVAEHYIFYPAAREGIEIETIQQPGRPESVNRNPVQ